MFPSEVKGLELANGMAMPGGYSAVTTRWPSWAAGSDQPARRSVFVIGHFPLILASTASRPS